MQLPLKPRRQKNHQSHLAKPPHSFRNDYWNTYSTQITLLLLFYNNIYTVIECPVLAPRSHPTSIQQGIMLTSKAHCTVPADPNNRTHIPEKNSWGWFHKVLHSAPYFYSWKSFSKVRTQCRMILWRKTCWWNKPLDHFFSLFVYLVLTTLQW